MAQSAFSQQQKRQFCAATKRMPPLPLTISLLLALLLCCFVSEQQVSAEQQAAIEESPFQSWFNRQIRAPKPKFIRFGRANGGQKFIRFGKRSSAPEYDGAENVDELIDVVEDLYPAQQQLRQLAYISAPKRAQKFIRFG